MYEIVVEMSQRQTTMESRCDAIEEGLRTMQVKYMQKTLWYIKCYYHFIIILDQNFSYFFC